MVDFMENPIYKWMIWSYPHVRKPPFTMLNHLYKLGFFYHKFYDVIIYKMIFPSKYLYIYLGIFH